MKRRSLLAIAAISAFAWSQTLAAQDINPPTHLRAHGKVITHSSMKTVSMVQGDNLIGKPVSFECKSSSGCIAILSAAIHTQNNNQTRTCIYVDGTVAAPGCGIQDMAFFRPRQFSEPTGRGHAGLSHHSGDNKLVNTEGQIVGWTLEYTIYERHFP